MKISEKQVMQLMSLIQTFTLQPVILDGLNGVTKTACQLLLEIYSQQSEELKEIE